MQALASGGAKCNGRVMIGFAMIGFVQVWGVVASMSQPPVLASHNGMLDEVLTATTGVVNAGSFRFTSRLFNGTIPGPTLQFQAGDRVRIRLENQLGPNPGSERPHNQFRKPNTVNLHTHGLHVSGESRQDGTSQDDVFAKVEPGQSHQYDYEIHPEHGAGTYWYHPHYHGSTALQTTGGMAGAIVVKDAPTTTAAQQLLNMADHVMLMQHINFGTLSSGWPNIGLLAPGDPLKFTDTLELARLAESTLDTAHTGTGETVLVNGLPKPTVTMRPGEWQRWRLIFAAGGSSISLQLTGCSLKLIATDGVYLTSGQPQDITSVSLNTGSRRDVLAMCPTTGAYTLSSMAVGGDTFISVGTVIHVNVSGSTVNTAAPTTLPPLPRYL